MTYDMYQRMAHTPISVHNMTQDVYGERKYFHAQIYMTELLFKNHKSFTAFVGMFFTMAPPELSFMWREGCRLYEQQTSGHAAEPMHYSAYYTSLISK